MKYIFPVVIRNVWCQFSLSVENYCETEKKTTVKY